MVVMAAPMSVLVSTLMAFGGLATDMEYTAATAAGVSPLRLMRPIIFAGLFLSIATAWFSNEILPDLNFRAGNIFLDIRRAKPGFELRPNTFYDGIRGYTFLARSFSAEQDTLYDVTLFQEPNGFKKEAIIDARFATLKSEPGDQLLTMVLYDGTVRRFFLTRPENLFTVERSRFESHRMSFDISDLNFSRGGSERQRSERSTRAQEMLVISDSLEQAITTSLGNFLDINRGIVGYNIIEDSVESTYEDKIIEADSMSTSPLFTYIPFIVEIRNSEAPTPTDSLLLAFKALRSNPQIGSLISAAKNGTSAMVNTMYDMETNLQWKKRKKASYDVEIFKKMTIPLACLLFVFIGASIGLLTRHGNIGFAAVVSTFILTFYWIATLQGEKLADRLIIEPWIGTWFANAVIALASIILMLNLQQPWKKAQELSS